MVDIVSLREKLASFESHWDPKIVAELNGQQVKVAKVHGDFIWHHHENEDELFLVLSGKLTIELRDRQLELEPGELCVIPRGVEHRPVAKEETHILLFEPAATLNTGNRTDTLTVNEPERI